MVGFRRVQVDERKPQIGSTGLVEGPVQVGFGKKYYAMKAKKISELHPRDVPYFAAVFRICEAMGNALDRGKTENETVAAGRNVYLSKNQNGLGAHAFELALEYVKKFHPNGIKF